MKSEHRHELQTNELRKLADRAAPWVEQYGKYILGGLAALALVILVGLWWAGRSNASAAVAWTQLLEARSAEDFANIAEKHSGTPAANWARLREAEMHLESGMQLLFSNREAGLADLKQAREGFEALVGQTGLPQEIRERALFGLGRTLESTSTGDTGEAITVYQRLLNEFPESIYAPVAKRRVETLETGGAKEFYTWFAQKNPKPPEPARPRDGQSPLPPSPDSVLTPPTPPTPAEKQPTSEATSEPEPTNPASATQPE